MMAGPTCNPFPASEVALVDGECVLVADYGEVALCFDGPAGGDHVPGPSWYQVSTGRVFGFGSTVSGDAPGWRQCECNENDAPACACSCSCGGCESSSSET